MIKESITKKIKSNENLQEVFGMFGGGKKKEKPKASGGGRDKNVQQLLLNIFKMKGTDQFVAAYNKNPGLFVSAVRLGVEGLPKDNRFRNPLMKRYKPYIDKLFKVNPKGIEKERQSEFGRETEKFVFALQDYAKDEMDPNLKQLAKNLEKIR